MDSAIVKELCLQGAVATVGKIHHAIKFCLTGPPIQIKIQKRRANGLVRLGYISDGFLMPSVVKNMLA